MSAFQNIIYVYVGQLTAACSPVARRGVFAMDSSLFKITLDDRPPTHPSSCVSVELFEEAVQCMNEMGPLQFKTPEFDEILKTGKLQMLYLRMCPLGSTVEELEFKVSDGKVLPGHKITLSDGRPLAYISYDGVVFNYLIEESTACLCYTPDQWPMYHELEKRSPERKDEQFELDSADGLTHARPELDRADADAAEAKKRARSSQESQMFAFSEEMGEAPAAANAASSERRVADETSQKPPGASIIAASPESAGEAVAPLRVQSYAAAAAPALQLFAPEVAVSIPQPSAPVPTDNDLVEKITQSQKRIFDWYALCLVGGGGVRAWRVWRHGGVNAH
jgi:hypothetical protein